MPDPELLCWETTAPPFRSPSFSIAYAELKIRTTDGSTCLAMACNEELSCSSELAADPSAGREVSARSFLAEAARLSCTQPTITSSIQDLLIKLIIYL